MIRIMGNVSVVLILAVIGMLLLQAPERKLQRPQDHPQDVVNHSDSSKSATPLADLAAANTTPTLVGRDVCRECHQENHQLHSQSGHASTFASTSDSEIAKKFIGKTLDAGQPFGMLEYSAGRSGLSVKRVGAADEESFSLDFALGSGHNAVTLFSLVPDAVDGTIGIEHCVSWFSDSDHFGLTPGQLDTPQASVEKLMGNSIRGNAMHSCVRCHTTSGTIINQEIVDLVPNVNCEKCHGPGSEHVRQARLSKSPPPFSVGRSDWNGESELQLCGSCHRMPIDISPKKLREYPSSLARFQPVGMLRSECFLKSGGELKCTTCHNPHQSSTAKSKAAYVDDCVRCHQESSSDQVACPVSPQKDCVECHMPPLSFEQGMIFHDHWIRVRPAD